MEFAPRRRAQGGFFGGLRGRLGLRRPQRSQFKRVAQRLLDTGIVAGTGRLDALDNLRRQPEPDMFLGSEGFWTSNFATEFVHRLDHAGVDFGDRLEGAYIVSRQLANLAVLVSQRS